MKRSFVIFCTLMIGALSFSSCNKNLKDDLNDLRNTLGANEPIHATTTFTDKNNVARTFTTSYKLKGAASYSNALIKEQDGLYEIRISRFENLDSEIGIGLNLVYDANNKKILYKEVRQYWEDSYSNGRIEVYEEDEPTTGLTFNVNIKSIDLESGNIVVEVKIEGTKEYALDNEWDVPNKNSSFSTSFSFSGNLKKFEENDLPN